MCFRPAESSFAGPVRCPVCGKINRPDATVCIKCSASEEDMQAAAEVVSAPKAPGAPAAPRVPGTVTPAGTPLPAAPKVPGVPPKAQP